MTALIIVFGILFLIALLRFGVAVVYNESGLAATAKVGPLSIRIFPRKEKPERRKKKPAAKVVKKKKEKKERKKREKEPEKPEEKPGLLDTFFEMLRAAGVVLGRIRRRLFIKRLILHYTAGGLDPAKTALTFGRLSAASSLILPALEKNFRIRRCDIKTSADFESDKPHVYINAGISLAVWESLYIVFALLPVLLKLRRQSGKKAAGAGPAMTQESGSASAD